MATHELYAPGARVWVADNSRVWRKATVAALSDAALRVSVDESAEVVQGAPDAIRH